MVDAQSVIADKLIEIGSKQLKKGLKEAHDQLKVHNAELIEKAFLDAKNCRWKFSRILKHFGTNPEHEGLPFVSFIETMKDSSKANVAEMEKMMDSELQSQIADKALDDYSNQLEDLMKRSMSRYTSRLEQAKMSCIMNQIKIGMEETKVEMQELRDKFKTESENSFEAQMTKYLQKMNMIEAAITTKYEACYNTENFELCLTSFIEVRILSFIIIKDFKIILNL